MIVRPPRPRFSSLDVLPEFVVWSESPAGTSLRLPRFFSGELPSSGLAGLWLQADGCCSRASWVSIEVSASSSMVLTRGWHAFPRARGLGGRCTLHFKYDGLATLYVRVFREDGRRMGCCPEDGSDDDGGDGELVLGDARSSSRDGSSSSDESSSSGGYDRPPCRRAWVKDGGGSSRRSSLMKLERSPA